MADERVLLTIVLHHDQSRPLEEIMAHAKKTSYDFAPIAAQLERDHT